MMDPRDEIDIQACVAIDSETCLIRAGLPAPPVVCLSTWEGRESAPKIFGAHELYRPLAELLDDERRLIVAHNGAYDFACFLEWYPELRPAIYRAYEQNRILDTMLSQRIVEIETGDKRGKLALDQLCARYGLHVEKTARSGGDPDDEESGDVIRLGFGKFWGRPAAEIPSDYAEYALGDPVVTLKLFERILSRQLVKRRDAAKFGRSDLSLKLISAEGLMCDPERVSALERQAIERRAILTEELQKARLVRFDRKSPDPVKNMARIKKRVAEAFELPHSFVEEIFTRTGTIKKAAQCEYNGSDAFFEDLLTQGILTEKGNISTGRLVLEESGDPLLAALAEFNEWGAVWNKDLPIFRAATEVPFHTRFGFAATTRTTSSGPNIQNFRKKEGIRECIWAPGNVLVATDYSGLENATLAQVIAWVLGRKGPAEKYSSGWDDHCDVAQHILGCSYEEAVRRCDAGEKEAKEARGAAKPLNFGLPGYMTRPSTVQSYARIGYKVNRPVEFWEGMIALWYRTQVDKVAYLKEYVDNLKAGSTYNVPIPATGITRRGATRTAAGNTPFQGLGAQVALEAAYRVTREQMLGRMPGKACAFVHDEIISRADEDRVEELRAMQERIMIDAAQDVMPDIRMRVESVAMRHWAKGAKHKVIDGRLQVQNV